MNHALKGIPDTTWATIKQKAGNPQRLQEGLALLVDRWAAGTLDPFSPDPGCIATGRQGGLVRASRLTAKRRSDICRVAAQTRWAKRPAPSKDPTP